MFLVFTSRRLQCHWRGLWTFECLIWLLPAMSLGSMCRDVGVFFSITSHISFVSFTSRLNDTNPLLYCPTIYIYLVFDCLYIVLVNVEHSDGDSFCV